MHYDGVYLFWIETSANVLTKLLDFESGLLCFDRVSICRKKYSAFWNVEFVFI